MTSSKVTTKFIAKGGKHTYIEIPRERLQQFSDIIGKYKFLLVDGTRYEFAGNQGPIPVFREVQMNEIKIAKVVEQPSFTEKFIKTIAIKGSIKQHILDITSKGEYSGDFKNVSFEEVSKGLYPKEKAKLKVLWYTAKRDSLADIIKENNVQQQEGKASQLQGVYDFLNKQITISLQEYKNFPELK